MFPNTQRKECSPVEPDRPSGTDRAVPDPPCDRVDHAAGCVVRIKEPGSRRGTTGEMQHRLHSMPLRRGDLVCEELDGEAILYDSRCGAVHHFNAMTLCVWNACDGSHTAAAIATALAERHVIRADEALAHVEQLIAEFRARDLLQGGCMQARNGMTGGAAQPTAKTIIGITGTAEGPCDTATSSERPRRDQAKLPSLSRRELVRDGVGKLVFVTPIILTFFAEGAYASAPPASGPGGCKNVGFSCQVNNDCCDFEGSIACEGHAGTKRCCVRHGGTGCTVDADCCDQADVCVGGECE
jgi:PqqD family protein of HPr-rel-A system